MPRGTHAFERVPKVNVPQASFEQAGSSLFTAVLGLIAALIPPLQAAVRRLAEQESAKEAQGTEAVELAQRREEFSDTWSHAQLKEMEGEAGGACRANEAGGTVGVAVTGDAATDADATTAGEEGTKGGGRTTAPDGFLAFSLNVDSKDEEEILQLVENVVVMLEDNLHPFELFEEWAHYHSRRYDYDHDVDFDFIGSSNAGSGAKESRFRVPLGPGDRLGIVLFIQQLESLFLQLCGFRRDQSSGVLEMYPTTEKMFAAGVRGLGALACVSGMPTTFFSFIRVALEYEMNYATSVLFPFARDPGRASVDRAARRVAWACQIALDSSAIAVPLDGIHRGNERLACPLLYFRKPKERTNKPGSRRRRRRKDPERARRVNAFHARWSLRYPPPSASTNSASSAPDARPAKAFSSETAPAPSYGGIAWHESGTRLEFAANRLKELHRIKLMIHTQGKGRIIHNELWSLAEVLMDLAMALVNGEDSIVARGFIAFPCILHPSIGAFHSCNELLTYVLAMKARMSTTKPHPEPWSCLTLATVSFCIAFTDANLVVAEIVEKKKTQQEHQEKHRDEKFAGNRGIFDSLQQTAAEARSEKMHIRRSWMMDFRTNLRDEGARLNSSRVDLSKKRKEDNLKDEARYACELCEEETESRIQSAATDKMLNGLLSDRVAMRDLSLFFLEGRKDSHKGDYRFLSTRNRMSGCLRRAAFSLPDDLFENKVPYDGMAANTSALIQAGLQVLADAEQKFKRIWETMLEKNPAEMIESYDPKKKKLVRIELLEMEAALQMHRVKAIGRTAVIMYVESQLQGNDGKKDTGLPSFAHSVAKSLRHSSLMKCGFFASQLARMCTDKLATWERAAGLGEGRFGLGAARCRREHALSCGRAFTTLDGDEQFDQYGNFQRKDVMKQVHGSSDTQTYRKTLVRLGVLKQFTKAIGNFPNRPETVGDLILAIAFLLKRAPRVEFRTNGENAFYSPQDVLMRAIVPSRNGFGHFVHDRNCDRPEQLTAALKTIKTCGKEGIHELRARTSLISWIDTNDSTVWFPPLHDRTLLQYQRPQRKEIRFQILLSSFRQERNVHHKIGRLLNLKDKRSGSSGNISIADDFPAKMKAGLATLKDRGELYTLEMRGRYHYALRMCGILRPRPNTIINPGSERLDRTWEKLPRQAWQECSDQFDKEEEERRSDANYRIDGSMGDSDSDDQNTLPPSLSSVLRMDSAAGFGYSSKTMFSHRSGELRFESRESLRGLALEARHGEDGEEGAKYLFSCGVPFRSDNWIEPSLFTDLIDHQDEPGRATANTTVKTGSCETKQETEEAETKKKDANTDTVAAQSEIQMRTNDEYPSIRDYRMHMTMMMGYGPRTQGSEVLSPFRSTIYGEGHWPKPKHAVRYSIERARQLMQHAIIGDAGLHGENRDQWETKEEDKACKRSPRNLPKKMNDGKEKKLKNSKNEESSEDWEEREKWASIHRVRALDPRTFMGSLGTFVESLYDCLEAQTVRRAERMEVHRHIERLKIPRAATAFRPELKHCFDDNGPDGIAYRDAMVSLMLSCVELGRMSTDIAVSLLQLQFCPTEHQEMCFGLDKADAKRVRENAKDINERRERFAFVTGDIDAVLDVPTKYPALDAERLEAKIKAVCASSSFRASNFELRNDNYYRRRLAGHLHMREGEGIYGQEGIWYFPKRNLLLLADLILVEKAPTSSGKAACRLFSEAGLIFTLVGTCRRQRSSSHEETRGASCRSSPNGSLSSVSSSSPASAFQFAASAFASPLRSKSVPASSPPGGGNVLDDDAMIQRSLSLGEGASETRGATTAAAAEMRTPSPTRKKSRSLFSSIGKAMRRLSGMKSKKQLAAEKEAMRRQEEAERRATDEGDNTKAAAEAERRSMAKTERIAKQRGPKPSIGLPGIGYDEGQDDVDDGQCLLDYSGVFILDPVTGKSSEPIVPLACASTTGEGLPLLYPDPNPLSDEELLKVISALVRVLKSERKRANLMVDGRVPRCDAVLRGSSIVYLSTIVLGVPELRQELFDVGAIDALIASMRVCTRIFCRDQHLMIRGFQAIMKILRDCNQEERKGVLEAMQHVKERKLDAKAGQLYLLASEVQDKFHECKQLQDVAKAIFKIIDEETTFFDKVSVELRKSLGV